MDVVLLVCPAGLRVSVKIKNTSVLLPFYLCFENLIQKAGEIVWKEVLEGMRKSHYLEICLYATGSCSILKMDII